MDFSSLDDLRQADELTLRFTSFGFHTGGMLTPEAAAQYQQEVISRAELAAQVAEGTRGTFDRLRLLHSYGVLSYDMFTAAYDLANLVVEQALRDRFVEFYGDVVQFEDAHGMVHPVSASTFDALFEEMHAEGRLHRPERWRLRLRAGGIIYFDGMLDSLLRWARSEGLLRGQRNRQLDPVLKKLRNFVAHGGGHHRVMPVDSARAISDAAEIINHLWGFPTPGGRLYPAPIRRVVQVVAWNASGSVISGPAGLPPDPRFEDWTYVIVRAVLHDEGLSQLDALFETTTYPCDVLWGPGSCEDAAAWLEQEKPVEDEVDVLDRLFLVQSYQGRLCLPRSPAVAAGLEEEERMGTWQLIQADYPADALRHARAIATGQCPPGDGPCRNCPAETVGNGTWQEMIDLAIETGDSPILPQRPPDVRVPSFRTWPRYFETANAS